MKAVVCRVVLVLAADLANISRFSGHLALVLMLVDDEDDVSQPPSRYPLCSVLFTALYLHLPAQACPRHYITYCLYCIYIYIYIYI